MEKKREKRVDKKILTFFLIAFPTIMIILMGYLSEGTAWAQIVLAVYQFILLKQFLDNYYEVLE